MVQLPWALYLPCTSARAATDGMYNLTATIAAWDGTDADRLKGTSADYNYAYGDETSITYTLPWSFSYYGQGYSQNGRYQRQYLVFRFWPGPLLQPCRHRTRPRNSRLEQ